MEDRAEGAGVRRGERTALRTPQTTYGPPVVAGTYAVKTLMDTGLAPASALDHPGIV